MKCPSRKPTHVHDCERCTFLGRDTEANSDWYVCESDHGSRTLIERFSSDAPDYTSTPVAGCVEATRLELRAALRGFRFTDAEFARFGRRYIHDACFGRGLAHFRELAPDAENEYALGDADPDSC